MLNIVGSADLQHQEFCVQETLWFRLSHYCYSIGEGVKSRNFEVFALLFVINK
jgi:hypothetical protein